MEETTMKKMILLTVVLCLLLVGCGKSFPEATTEREQLDSTKAETELVDSDSGEQDVALAVTVYPLPDTTMENLTDATLSISLDEGDAYVDDTGKMQMKVKIYTYDLYDAKDITQLKVGDIIVRHADEVTVTSVERGESGFLCINGGLESGGFDLADGGGGIFYEIGFNDVKNWYELGEATIRVSVDFIGYDRADPERGEVVIYPGDFLVDAVTDYNFTPYNTTIRIEAGQIVEMTRVFVP